MGKRTVHQLEPGTKVLAFAGPAMATLGVLGLVPVRNPEVVAVPWQFRVAAVVFLVPGVWLSRRAYRTYRRAGDAAPGRALPVSVDIEPWYEFQQTLLVFVQCLGGALLPMGLIGVIVGFTEGYPVLAAVGLGLVVVGTWSLVAGVRRYRGLGEPARRFARRRNPRAYRLNRQWELLATSGVFTVVIPVAVVIFLINLG